MKNLLTSCCLFILLIGSIIAQAEPVEIPLIAGKTKPVGIVHVWNDEANLYLQVELDELVVQDGWCLTDIKLHIGQGLEDFPLTKKGNPKLGHFDYEVDLGCAALSDPIAIEMGELASAESLLVALKANIKLEECLEGRNGVWDCTTYSEGAWANGVRFVSKGNWATYFAYEMQSQEPEPIPCCDLQLEILSFDPMAAMPIPTLSNYTFIICGGVVIDAFGSGSEEFSELSYNPETKTISFTMTYQDGTTSSLSLTLMANGSLISGTMPVSGYWNWSNCSD